MPTFCHIYLASKYYYVTTFNTVKRADPDRAEKRLSDSWSWKEYLGLDKKHPYSYSYSAIYLHRPSPTVITFFPISELSYKLIRFLLHSPIVKSDIEIRKFSY